MHSPRPMSAVVLLLLFAVLGHGSASADDSPFLSQAVRALTRKVADKDRDYGWARYASDRALRGRHYDKMYALDRLAEAYIMGGGTIGKEAADGLLHNAVKEFATLDKNTVNHRDRKLLGYGAKILKGRTGIDVDPVLEGLDLLAEYGVNEKFWAERRVEKIDITSKLIDRRELTFRIVQEIGRERPDLLPLLRDLTENAAADGGGFLPPGSLGKTSGELEARDPEYAALMNRFKDPVTGQVDGKLLIAELKRLQAQMGAEAEARGLQINNLSEKVDELAKARADAAAEAKFQRELGEFNRDVADARATVSLIVSLSNILPDPDLQKGVRHIGNVVSFAITIHENVGLRAFGQISSVAMSANIVGAGFALLSMFSDSPDPTQVILEEIAKVREDVQNLRIEMHERFDRLDRSLNDLLQLTSQGFQALMEGQKLTREKLEEINSRVQVLDRRMTRIEQNLPLYFESLQIDTSEQMVLNCIESKFRHRDHQIDRDSFIGCMNHFLGWGAGKTARAPNVSGLLGRTAKLEDAEAALQLRVASVLTDLDEVFQARHDDPVVATYKAAPVSVEENMNYLAVLLKEQYVGFNGRDLRARGDRELTLPNVGRWLYGAEGFLILTEIWPEHTRRAERINAKDFVDAAEDLIQFMSRGRDPDVLFQLYRQVVRESQGVVATLSQLESMFFEGKGIPETRFAFVAPESLDKVKVDYKFPAQRVGAAAFEINTDKARFDRSKNDWVGLKIQERAIDPVQLDAEFAEKIPAEVRLLQAAGIATLTMTVNLRWNNASFRDSGKKGGATYQIYIPKLQPSVDFEVWAEGIPNVAKTLVLKASHTSPEKFPGFKLPMPSITYLQQNWKDGQKFQENIFKNLAVTPEVKRLVFEQFKRSHWLQKYHLEFADQVKKLVGAADNNVLKLQIRRVAGSVAVVRAFVGLSFADLLHRDDVWEVLFGSNRLLDSETLLAPEYWNVPADRLGPLSDERFVDSMIGRLLGNTDSDRARADRSALKAKILELGRAKAREEVGDPLIRASMSYSIGKLLLDDIKLNGPRAKHPELDPVVELLKLRVEGMAE